jgi:predicted flap endonuclease-1-like 5' DNA nuclease
MVPLSARKPGKFPIKFNLSLPESHNSSRMFTLIGKKSWYSQIKCMAIPLKQIKGISDDLAEAFRKQGISSSMDFLDAARTAAHRKELSARTHVDTRMILEIANRCDLTRIRGVAGIYSDLLEEAGIDTVKELAGRVAENLHKKIREVNEAKRLTRRPPHLGAIQDWIAQARQLDTGLEY